jgi:hypothetical protein
MPTRARGRARRSHPDGHPPRPMAHPPTLPRPSDPAAPRADVEEAGRLRRLLAEAAPRDVDGGAYLQDFLVAAVVAILLTRVFLGLTGFPRLGGGGLHVAHLLWGGLLMVVALALLLAVLGKRAKRWAALIGGVGFGLFVDELGKFVTADNDYFFQPAIALIYTVLIGLFLAFRAIERRSLSAEEALVNAADMVRELVLRGATATEVGQALDLLERSQAEGAVAAGLREAIAGAGRATESAPGWWTRAATRARHVYDGLVGWRWFQRAVLVLFVGQALVGTLQVLVALLGVLTILFLPAIAASLDVPEEFRIVPRLVADPLSAVGPLVPSSAPLVSLVCAVMGVTRLRRSRLAAYRWLERSVLVSIFFVQVILFWQEQLGAVVDLAWDLLLLGALRYAIRQEEARRGLGGAMPTG